VYSALIETLKEEAVSSLLIICMILFDERYGLKRLKKLKRAISNQGRILVFWNYDVDGTAAVF
jgi:hypothetical protein